MKPGGRSLLHRTPRNLWIFAGLCVLGLALWFVNPTYESPYERFEKARYRGRFHLGIGEYYEAAESLYQAEVIGERDLFFIDGRTEEYLPAPDLEVLTNETTREITERMLRMRDSMLDREVMLEIYLSQAYCMYQLHHYGRMKEYLDRAGEVFPESKFVPLARSLYYHVMDPERTGEALSEMAALEPEGYEVRTKFKIFSIIFEEAARVVTNRSLIHDYLEHQYACSGEGT